jgi:protein tyrosine/serine phosphatase
VLDIRKLPVRARVSVLLLVVLAVAPTPGEAVRGGAPPPGAPDLTTIHIENFGRVNANYFRGSEPDDEEYESLASIGIRTVVDLRSGDVDSGDQELVARAGMRYVQIPMTTHQPPTAAVIEQFLQIVDDPENQPVYVHCVGGKHRTGVMTAVYRIARDHWTPDQAFKEMKAYKFGADFLHPEFKKFVYTYEPDSRLEAKVVGAH